MPATAPLPETSVPERLARALARGAGSFVGRYRLELLWGAFAAACYAAMFAWPKRQTVPFYLVWISLTLLYGLRVWPLCRHADRPGRGMILTGIPTAAYAMGGADAVQKLVKVPLMAMLFLAVVWHARRRVRRFGSPSAALPKPTRCSNARAFHPRRVAELRTPLTIARGHLELLGENPRRAASSR